MVHGVLYQKITKGVFMQNYINSIRTLIFAYKATNNETYLNQANECLYKLSLVQDLIKCKNIQVLPDSQDLEYPQQ